MAEIEHGKRSTYVHRGCRCAACTAANRDEMADFKAKRYGERVQVDGQWVHLRAVHGTVSAYRNWGCRCQECLDAHMAAHTAWRKRRKEVGGRG